jgi:hypothetical protein
MVRRSVVGLVALTACVGLPPAPPTGGELAEGTQGTTAAPTAESSPPGDDGTTLGPLESTGSAGSTDSGDGGSGSSSGSGPGVDPCAEPVPVTFEIDVTEALLSDPMQLGMSGTEGAYAYSEVAGQGEASFQFLVPCEAEFRAWARVYDPAVGISGVDYSDPDSFLVAFDGEADTEWWYGCQTNDGAVSGSVWAWAVLMDNAWCTDTEFLRTLTAGTHLLHLTNREAGNHAMQTVAAVTRVVVTSDPAYAPP